MKIRRVCDFFTTILVAGILYSGCLTPDTADAQWQVPDHSVPIGRGAGTGFKNAAPGTSGYPLLSTGASTDPAFGPIATSALTFTQNGTGAVSVTFDQLYRGIIVTPEMFGDGVACSTASAAGIQRAITYLGTIGRGRVQLSNCTYAVSGPINIASDGITLQGYGGTYSTNTRIVFTPSAAGQCAINIANGASILSNAALRHLTIATADTTTYKTGICAADGSTITLDDVFVRSFTGGVTAAVTGAVNNGSGEIRLTVVGAAVNWNDGWAVAVSGVVGTTEANSGWPIVVSGANTIDLKGSTFTNAYVSGGTITASSTGLQLKGRELYALNNVSITADLPIRISANPNVAHQALDETNFNNMSLGSALGTNCVVMADNDTVLSSVSFLGIQSWGGGKDGFCWRDKVGAAISEQLRFDNVRVEQKTVAGGSYFNIQPANTLYSLSIINPLFADRNGVLARNVGNLRIADGHWLSAAGVCLDIDSTVQNTTLVNDFWIAGASTATLTSQILQYSNGKNPSTGCLPGTAIYSNTRVRNQSAGLDIDDTITVAGNIQSGNAGVANGSLTMKGTTSGAGTATAQAIMGTPAWVWPTNSGTFAVSASAPLALSATTGNLTISAIPLTAMATQATNTVVGNATSGSAVPTALAVGTCSTSASALNWTTNTGFGCNTAVNAAQLGGATFSAPGAIGGGTPSTGAFTTITASSTINATGIITSGTNAAKGSAIANGPNSGTAGGSTFVSQLNGASNIGMGNVSALVTGGAFDSTPAIFGGAAIGVYIAGTTQNLILGPNYVVTNPVAVGGLPSCVAGLKGARAFVTDELAAVAFNTVATGGGANNVPVFCDGTNWRIG